MSNDTIARASYVAARDRIALGAWSVDAKTGTIFSHVSGRKIGHVSAGGYVVLSLHIAGRKRVVMAHRVIWEAEHGFIPDGLEVNHINGVKHDNRICNLELVTCRENIAHAVNLGLRMTLRGSDVGGSKLAADDVRAIRARRAAGEQMKSIASDYGLHPGYVSLLVRRKRWAHV